MSRALPSSRMTTHRHRWLEQSLLLGRSVEALRGGHHALLVHHRLHHHLHHVHALLHHLHLSTRVGRHALLRHHPATHGAHFSVTLVHLIHHGHASVHFFPLLVH